MRFCFALLLGLLAVSQAGAQTYNWKQVQISGGGYVTGILFHPNEQGLMYCRTDIGGSYRWNPADDTWIPLLDFIGYPNNEWSLIGTESIGLDAQDPDRLYLSCGWLGNPSEIMISTDRGASFTRISSPFVVRANDGGRGTGERFGVDPNLGSTLFYGTRQDGLWKSVNHGANWAKVTSFPVNTTANGVGLAFVEFIQSSGTPGSATPEIWVGVSQAGTNLYRSTDGGATWTGVPTTGVPTNCMPLRASQDGLGNMYITLCDGAGPGDISTGVVRKYNLGTLTSIDVTPPTGQGGYGGVSVDRQNPNIIAVTTANRWWPRSDIYRSTNGGTSWTAVYDGTVDTSSAPWMGAGGNIVQGWMSDIKIDPYNSDRVYYVSGGGVFSSYNFTAATPSWQFRSTGIEETAFTGVGTNLASPPTGPLFWSVLGDMGGFTHYDLTVSPAPSDFHNPNGLNNHGIDFAELSPNLVVRTYLDRVAPSRGGLFSTDWGSTWSEFPTIPPPAQTAGPGYAAISADGSRMVWTIPGSAPYFSTDQGNTWSPCAGSNLTPSESWEEPFNFSDRVNPNKFYLYYRVSGRVFVSTDGGASFVLANTIAAWGDSMRPVYGHEGHLWVTAYDGLWRTTNSGASFSKVAGVQAARTVGFGRTATGTGHPVAYLHGKINDIWGIYRSEDQGANWTRINDDQHQFGNIQQVVGDPKIYGRVYVAAGGRGILYSDLVDAPTPTLPEGWSSRDIGGPALVGAAGETDDTFTVRGSGWDIWGAWDQFHYASRVVHGDAGIVARVTSLTNTDTWAKAGVMFRAGLAADAPFVALFQRPDRQVTFQWRTATGANAELTAGSGLFGNTTDLKWLRLQRSGDTFSAAYSSDGTAWTTIATTPTIVLPSSAELGLALTAHNGNVLGTATFSNVVLTPEPLAITTATALPGASAGHAYTTTLAARGGFPDYLWALDSGTLPPGLALDPETGLLGGTPETAGAFAFTARATDADGATATRGFTLAVQGPPYASWLSEYFTPAEQADPLLGGSISADPDADTLPNLVEWALGRDPRTPDAAGALDFAVTPGAALGTSDFVVTFTRRRAAPGVAWAVETSSDLASPEWTNLPEGDPSWTVSDDPGGLTQTVTVRIPLGAADRVFARLRVTQD